MARSKKPIRSGDSSLMRKLAVSAAGLHLVVVGLAALPNDELPESLANIPNLCMPYLQMTHFGFEGDPIHLARGEREEQAIQLEYSTKTEPASDDWQIVEWNVHVGLADSDRRQRFLAAAALLAEGERFGLLARWILPLVEPLEQAKSVRLARVPTLLTTVADDDQPPPYQARVLRDGDQVHLVHVQPPRLVAKSSPGKFTEKTEESLKASSLQPTDTVDSPSSSQPARSAQPSRVISGSIEPERQP